MDDNSNVDDTSDPLGSAPEDVMDIDESAKKVGLRSGQEYDKNPEELNTEKDLNEDEQSDWES